MSSLKDSASLIMIPSLYKDGRLDTIKPLGNSILHPDATGSYDGTDGSTPAEGNFTFSRGSNLAATRVDVNGLIEKGRENLILQSESFDNASWTKADSSVIANATTSPNGTTTADKLIQGIGNTNHFATQSVTASNEVYTYSLYIKPDTTTRVRIQMSDLTTGDIRLDYDFSTEGIKHNVDGSRGSWSSIGYKITDIANGWKRFSVSGRKGAGSVISSTTFLLDASGNTIYTGDGTSGLFVWGAQLEKSLVATDYIETGASTAQAGILEDMPRLDYSGGASCPALLLEPQRTNSVDYSEGGFAFQGSTSGTGVTPVITENDAISPEGVQNAFRVDLDRGAGNSSSDWSWIYRNGIAYSGTNQISVYLKAATSSDIGKEVSIRYGGSASAITLTADWKRYSVIKTLTATSEVGLYSRGGENADNAVSCYVYGWQVENNSSYPTSYIPTYGTSQTRISDVVGTIDVSSLGVTTGYTLFFEIGENDLDSTTWLIQRNSNGAFLYQQYGYTAILNIPSGVVYPFGLTSGRNKVAIVFDGTNIYPFLNGVKQGTYVASDDWASFGVLNLNNNPTRVNWKQLLVFPTALTDSECIALTSI